ncbi:acyltransferase family protein [Brevibacillus daliensis]|uniref:acyltransferase family protein n=1 Tax=Brevibacillus daliensis TaxID=2892995 RepID=UPI001E401C30|nr:acyltransferase [Brevibacillus daliensis]
MNNGIQKLTYLDGLRGVAALIVVVSHFVQLFYPALFSLREDQSHYEWELLIGSTPLNIFYNGNFAVCIFFVLSGFVLSYQYFQQKKRTTLISGASKRYLRLAIPVFVSVLLVYGLMMANAFHVQHLSSYTFSTIGNYTDSDQLDVFTMIKTALIDLFFLYDSSYNPVLWTMTYELLGSFMVFLFLAFFGNAKQEYRFIMYVILTLVFIESYYLAFILGMFLCDLYHHARGRFNLRIHVILWLLAVGLYLGSYPYSNANLTIHQFITFSGAPFNQFQFYHIIAAFILMYVMVASPGLQSFFSKRMPLFLGEISFSLYLLHFTILTSLSSYVFEVLILQFPYHISFVITVLISMPVMILGSSIMSRYVDQKAMRWSSQLYHELLGQKLEAKQQKNQRVRVKMYEL